MLFVLTKELPRMVISKHGRSYHEVVSVRDKALDGSYVDLLFKKQFLSYTQLPNHRSLQLNALS